MRDAISIKSGTFSDSTVSSETIVLNHFTLTNEYKIFSAIMRSSPQSERLTHKSQGRGERQASDLASAREGKAWLKRGYV